MSIIIFMTTYTSYLLVIF